MVLFKKLLKKEEDDVKAKIQFEAIKLAKEYGLKAFKEGTIKEQREKLKEILKNKKYDCISDVINKVINHFDYIADEGVDD